MVKQLVLELDELDFDAVQRAIGRRQALGRWTGAAMLPDGDGNLAGRYIAEICRGWMEFMDISKRGPDGGPSSPSGL